MKWLRSVEKEIILVILGLALLIGLPFLLRLIDPTAGTVDIGILHLIWVGVLRAFIITLALFLIIRIAFPLFEDYLETGKLREDWQALSPALRVSIFFATVAMILLVLTLCVVLV